MFYVTPMKTTKNLCLEFTQKKIRKKSKHITFKNSTQTKAVGEEVMGKMLQGT